MVLNKVVLRDNCTLLNGLVESTNWSSLNCSPNCPSGTQLGCRSASSLSTKLRARFELPRLSTSPPVESSNFYLRPCHGLSFRNATRAISSGRGDGALGTLRSRTMIALEDVSSGYVTIFWIPYMPPKRSLSTERKVSSVESRVKFSCLRQVLGHVVPKDDLGERLPQ